MGSVTVAIGSPFGLSGTVTSGVVSAVDRPLQNEADVAVNMIQTDAAINPGNSGGALANINGEVIGVNAEILSQSGDNNGIGFAIPIRTAMAVAAKITAGHSLAKPVVGVQVRNDPSGAAGAYVVTVNPGGPAAKAGLRTGDLIAGHRRDTCGHLRRLRGRGHRAQPRRPGHACASNEGARPSPSRSPWPAPRPRPWPRERGPTPG